MPDRLNHGMPLVLALADDLTGALEAGARFAECGFPAAVTVRRAGKSNLPVAVVDTESRHLSEDEAANVVARAFQPAAGVIYKKTDSTLRGNIGAELRALSRQLPGARIAYLPAYPAVGRTVRDGCLFVHGVPVHQTSFARDALNPITDSKVKRVLGDLPNCAVYDGETDNDLAAAMTNAMGDPSVRIIAGPASVASHIAAHLKVPPAPRRPWPAASRCLVVNGSRHEVSCRQIACATESASVSTAPGSAWQFLPPLTGTMSASDFASATGRLVSQHIAAQQFDTLMVFGGDTAFGILTALGCPVLEPTGEIVPGVPVSLVCGRNLHLITKSGGFGDEALIARVKQKLHDAKS